MVANCSLRDQTDSEINFVSAVCRKGARSVVSGMPGPSIFLNFLCFLRKEASRVCLVTQDSRHAGDQLPALNQKIASVRLTGLNGSRARFYWRMICQDFVAVRR